MVESEEREDDRNFGEVKSCVLCAVCVLRSVADRGSPPARKFIAAVLGRWARDGGGWTRRERISAGFRLGGFRGGFPMWGGGGRG
jgi:hypothetical protein